MRIIGGKWKRRKLEQIELLGRHGSLRPTSDRVRENIFNLLENSLSKDLVNKATVLDIFSGTGALGLEALSRGATTAVFVENDKISINILKKNIISLDASKYTQVITQDVTNIQIKFDNFFNLVFLDPPYGQRLGEKAMASIISNNYLSKGAIVVWEENLPIILPRALDCLDERHYGQTLVYFLRVK
tara:strand:+ start:344 stop:904 length:561 start_codon:yes stop_codon:yes gene_type:complete